MNNASASKRIFAPLWHPPEGGYSGGGYRAKRLLELMSDFQYVATDTDSTDVNTSSINGRLLLIHARRLYARGRWFGLLRVANWFWTFVATTAIGLSDRSSYDLVYVSYSELIHLTLAAFIVARARRIPLVLCNLNVRGTTLWSLNKHLHNRSQLVITLSEGLREELLRSGVTTPIALSTVGVDDHAVQSTPNKEFDGIFVGRHTTEKGVFDLIDIWERCCKTRPNLKLALVGPCTDAVRAQLKRSIADRRLEQNVVILGPVTEDTKWRLYARSRVCVFPSLVEGWGIVPIEAHLSRLPVVAYDLPAYDETIAKSPYATLCDVGDREAFSQATLARLEFLEGEQARSWALHFNWTSAAEREYSLLRNVLHC